MMKTNTCCFFGHRNINETEELKKKLTLIIESLIVDKQVDTFLFGSKSQFNSLCHKIVTELKERFLNIKRISYTCRSEFCILENEKQKWEKIYSYFEKKEVCILGFEEEVEHKTKYTSGKASYVERNHAMINDSDYCVFFYDEKYNPPKRKKSKKDLFEYQPKSGTKLAYNYAKQKRNQ